MGSNTVHLLVVDAHPGARPQPAHSHKAELRLAELLDKNGAIGPDGIDRLVSTIAGALRAAEDKGCEDVLAFATSAVREAGNADQSWPVSGTRPGWPRRSSAVRRRPG